MCARKQKNDSKIIPELVYKEIPRKMIVEIKRNIVIIQRDLETFNIELDAFLEKWENKD